VLANTVGSISPGPIGVICTQKHAVPPVGDDPALTAITGSYGQRAPTCGIAIREGGQGLEGGGHGRLLVQ
jgi:hypothetical protein